jgi:thiamine biosynthesis lipoprotein
MNRRDFIDPQSLARTAAGVLAVLDDVTDGGMDRKDEGSLLRFSRKAMATLFEVILPCGTPRAVEAAHAALDEIDRLEDQLTVYRDHSEVSRINQNAALSPVKVEPKLFQLFAQAERFTRDTDGAFDISVGALIKTWGFYRRAGQVPSEEARTGVMSCVGMQQVALDGEKQTISLRRPGVEINLGSIGKGYALDRIVELLRRDWSIASGLVHGGHSSIYAIGSEPGSRPGWPIALADPVFPRKEIAVLRLRDRAMGTSAVTFQNLIHEGRKLGHILDPRTGWPAEGILSASVLAPTAAAADALATAFYILGVEKTRAYCETHADISALLIAQDRRPVAINMPAAAIEWQ